ncbi:YolD-like family protein [Sporolactobacillus sp. THM19-2]|uniref:YolD-like family protein n=1 Tax=Sporolactobacillus sp. THM19-2 TaxID=2511171 RepID=UPI00101F2FE4|nr:YolD-like family protein [Sporolactobacillus sp. THM19-2]RYL94658.1 YolD-like family protein [Sporolactobacillus sp. THM19-2]
MKKNKLTPGQNLRWESSRMMLPEHVQALRNHLRDNEKIERPLLDEQEREEIGQKIARAAAGKIPATVSYYKDGFIRKMSGQLRLPDGPFREIEISDHFGVSWKVAFRDITGICLKE